MPGTPWQCLGPELRGAGLGLTGCLRVSTGSHRGTRLAPGGIPSQNPIENVNSKVPDLESKQRFSEDSEWSTLGALKMP